MLARQLQVIEAESPVVPQVDGVDGAEVDVEPEGLEVGVDGSALGHAADAVQAVAAEANCKEEGEDVRR